jgi:polyisoprenyl-phosphate glycosyltransferase
MMVLKSERSSSASPVNASVAAPVYKEAGSIKPFLHVEAVMERLGVGYELIFALVPSPDDTEAVIQREIERNPAVKLILFSRRFGQPAATMASTRNCTGEKCIVIDVDLQDQPEVIEQPYTKMAEVTRWSMRNGASARRHWRTAPADKTAS